ncbi:hypothetical protein HOT99_gp134 [Caulobacter phage CcrBL10]|uniref:Uncharacterized protein n=1 Tax=Caulobacter phage CcrBL10 TaxID=2283269 RepID=A0A385E9K6_9CAUD|nr:hypothetical protein HOT99_gp134 [Caulobacter phage CcrBL10]AXQ68483.1 hypothetical protein CcrBL10_gp279 [Caulobacter phage CcrBL10]
MSYREAEMEAQADFHANEMNVGDGAWGRYVKTLEKRLGFDLDGDNSEEAKGFFCDMGHSLDDTFEMFEKGVSVADAEKAILRSCASAAARAADAGVQALCEAQDRAKAAGKTDYVDLLEKQINALLDEQSAAATAAEKAFGC